jgi:hypothetical protein
MSKGDGVMTGKINSICLLILLSLGFTSACGVTPSPTAVPTATHIPPTATPTQPATVTVKPPEWAPGGPDEKLWKEINNSAYVQEQLRKFIEDWEPYWLRTGVIAPDIAEIRADLVFDKNNLPTGADDPDLKNKVNVLWHWDGVAHYFPIDTLNTSEEAGVKYQTTPPSGDVLVPFTDPLVLTPQGMGQGLVWRNGEWVSADSTTTST